LIAWSNATLFDKTGAVEYFIVTGIDITEQRRAKTALQESEALSRATFEQVAVGITCATLDGKFFQANDRFCQMLGYSRDEILTMTVADVTHPDDLAVDLAYLQEMNEGKRNSFALEKRYVRKDGDFVWVNLSVSLVHVPASGLKYAVGVVEDITERKQIEEESRRNYSFLQTLMDNLSVCVFVKSAEDGRFVLWNKATELLTGFTAEAVLGHTDYDFFPKEQADSLRQKDREVFEKRMTVDIPEEPLDSQSLGSRILHTVKTPIYDAFNTPLYLLGISEDITERVQAEAALRESEQRLELALKGADLGLWDLNVQTGVDIVDQRAAKMLGFSLDEIEPHVKWWDNRTHPDDLPRTTETFEAHLRGETPFYECEYRLLTKSGEWKWILDRGKIVQRDEQGHPFRLTGTHLDITERKQAEEALRIQNEQLQARNQELAAFARTVAHDLKNPLGALTGIAEILLEDYSHMPPEQLGEYLQSIVQGGRRASRIVEALLLLAGVRQRTVSLQPLDMASIVAESLQRLAEMIEQHQAEIIMPAKWPTALGYAPWIEEIWVNYLSNGLKYGGRPPRLELGATVQRNGMARFWVQDNGLGLTSEAQAQLFTEFTQLEQNRVDGYGLGLSIVRRIVEKLGGQVEVESEPGRGSLFSFTLPLVNLPPTSNDQ
jgi:PAS domain S-box-containing protein